MTNGERLLNELGFFEVKHPQLNDIVYRDTLSPEKHIVREIRFAASEGVYSFTTTKQDLRYAQISNFPANEALQQAILARLAELNEVEV